jgi:hypothetical protein
MSMQMRLRRYLLCLYPPAWRARYEDEFLAVLEASPLSLWTIWDVCVWAIDARLHFDAPTGRTPPLMNRFRATTVIVFCAYIGAVVAGLAFGKMLEYDDFRQLLRQDPQVSASYWTLYAGAFTALLAVLVAGLPIAFAAARSAIATKRWRLLALFAAPPLSLLLWLGAGALTVRLTPGDFVSKPLAQRLLVGGVFVGGIGLAALASAAAISILVIRAGVSERLFRFARVPALIAAVAMVVMVGATLMWGLAARAADPGLFSEDNGLLASNTTVSWLLILALMAIATVVAVAAAIRGARAGAGNRPNGTIAAQTPR